MSGLDLSGFDQVPDLDPDPDATDVNLLPFVLYDSDNPATGAPIGYLPVVLPDEWLAALLFCRTRPGQFSTTDATGRWQAVAEGLMHAALTQLRHLVADVHNQAATDPDAALWFEECREQVRRRLCPATEPDTPTPPARLRLVAPPERGERS